MFKSLWILGMGSFLICGQIFSNESLLPQPIKKIEDSSFLTSMDLINIRASIRFILSEFTKDEEMNEFHVNFEKFHDILGKIIVLSKEDRTNGLFFILSDQQIRQNISSIDSLEKGLSLLNRKKRFISELIDANLLKQLLVNWAISLGLDTTFIERHLDREEYLELVIHLIQIQ